MVASPGGMGDGGVESVASPCVPRDRTRFTHSPDLWRQWRFYCGFNVMLGCLGIALGIIAGHLPIGFVMLALAIGAIGLEWAKLRAVAMEVTSSEEAVVAKTAGGTATTLTWTEINQVRRVSVLRALVTFDVVRLVSADPRRQIVVTSVMGGFDCFMWQVATRARQAERPAKLRLWWETLYEFGIL